MPCHPRIWKCTICAESSKSPKRQSELLEEFVCLPKVTLTPFNISQALSHARFLNQNHSLLCFQAVCPTSFIGPLASPPAFPCWLLFSPAFIHLELAFLSRSLPSLPSLSLLLACGPSELRLVCGVSTFLSQISHPYPGLRHLSCVSPQLLLGSTARALVLLGPVSEAADTCRFLFVSFLCCHPAQIIKCGGGCWGE